MIGAQQVQPKSVKPPGLHPSLEQAGAQLQGNQVWRERLEQLLQVPATLEACIEELHRGRWAGLCRELCGPMLLPVRPLFPSDHGRPIPKEACVGAMDAWRAVSPCIWAMNNCNCQLCLRSTDSVQGAPPWKPFSRSEEQAGRLSEATCPVPDGVAKGAE